MESVLDKYILSKIHAFVNITVNRCDFFGIIHGYQATTNSHNYVSEARARDFQTYCPPP